jgi:hypothetical protein
MEKRWEVVVPRFTLPDGSKIEIDATAIARARPTIRNEIYGKPGHEGTALFAPKRLVLEPIDAVGRELQKTAPSFTRLHAPNGQSIWCQASKAKDAEAPLPTEVSPTTNAVVVMGGVRQRVRETVSEAQAILNSARAKA